jgi:hypothetical protein
MPKEKIGSISKNLSLFGERSISALLEIRERTVPAKPTKLIN